MCDKKYASGCKHPKCTLTHPLSSDGNGITKELARARFELSELKRAKYGPNKPVTWSLLAFGQAIHRNKYMSSTPSNALTIPPTVPSTVPSTAMTPSTAPSGGGALSISNTSDGTVELNLGGWIARSSQNDVLGLITAHTLKNCPNTH